MSEDRLSQIEAILLQVVQQQATLQQQQVNFQQQQALFQQDLTETWKIVDSNVRSIEANSNAIAELKRSQESFLLEFRENITDVVRMVGTLAQSADEDRQLIRGLQTQSNRILEHLFGRDENQGGE